MPSASSKLEVIYLVCCVKKLFEYFSFTNVSKCFVLQVCKLNILGFWLEKRAV